LAGGPLKTLDSGLHMIGRATLFDVLGVNAQATDDEVRLAWEDHFLNADADHERVPQEVRHAYQLLQDSGRRVWYRDMLRAAEIEHPVTVRPDEVIAFQRMCELALLRPYPDRNIKDTFLVRTHWQTPPRWNEDTQRFVPPPTRWQRLGKGLAAVFLMQCFRGKSPGQVLALTILYLIVLAPTVYAAWHGINVWSDTRARHLESALRDLSTRSADISKALDQRIDSLSRRFVDATGVPIGSCADAAFPKKAEVESALFKNPTAKSAWDVACTSFPKDSDLQLHRTTVADVSQRISKHAFLSEDVAQLEHTIAWLGQALGQLDEVDPKIDHIRTMIASERFGRISGPSAIEEKRNETSKSGG